MELKCKVNVKPNGVGLNTPQAIFQPNSLVKEWMESCIDFRLNNGGSILSYEPFDFVDEQINSSDPSILIKMPPEDGEEYSIYRINPMWWHGRLDIKLFKDGKELYYLPDCFDKEEYVDYGYFSELLFEESLWEAEKYLKHLGGNSYQFEQIGHKPIIIQLSPEEYEKYLAVECQVIQYRIMTKFLKIYNSLRDENFDGSLFGLKNDIGEIPKTLHQFLFKKSELV